MPFSLLPAIGHNAFLEHMFIKLHTVLRREIQKCLYEACLAS